MVKHITLLAPNKSFFYLIHIFPWIIFTFFLFQTDDCKLFMRFNAWIHAFLIIAFLMAISCILLKLVYFANENLVYSLSKQRLYAARKQHNVYFKLLIMFKLEAHSLVKYYTSNSWYNQWWDQIILCPLFSLYKAKWLFYGRVKCCIWSLLSSLSQTIYLLNKV